MLGRTHCCRLLLQRIPPERRVHRDCTSWSTDRILFRSQTWRRENPTSVRSCPHEAWRSVCGSRSCLDPFNRASKGSFAFSWDPCSLPRGVCRGCACHCSTSIAWLSAATQVRSMPFRRGIDANAKISIESQTKSRWRGSSAPSLRDGPLHPRSFSPLFLSFCVGRGPLGPLVDRKDRKDRDPCGPCAVHPGLRGRRRAAAGDRTTPRFVRTGPGQ